jgi:hypothetical protein
MQSPESTARPQRTSEATDVAQNAVAAEWVRQFAEGWAEPAGAREFCAHFAPILAPEIRLVQPRMATTTGLLAFERDFAEPLFAVMADLRATVEHWASLGETIFIDLTLSGTLRGGRHVSWRACDRVVLRGAQAVERESYFDPSPLLAAVIRSPRAWPAFMRLQLRSIRPRSKRPKETR